MATQITRIESSINYSGEIGFYFRTAVLPTGPGQQGQFTVTNVDGTNGSNNYIFTGNDYYPTSSFYGNTLVDIQGSIANPIVRSGTVRAKLDVDADYTETLNWTFKSQGVFFDGTTTPHSGIQGVSAVITPCKNSTGFGSVDLQSEHPFPGDGDLGIMQGMTAENLTTGAQYGNPVSNLTQLNFGTGVYWRDIQLAPGNYTIRFKENPSVGTEFLDLDITVPQGDCITCNAGTTVPTLNNTTLTNACPATSVNLNTVTSSNTPVNTVLQFHTSATPSVATLVSNTSISSTGTYYATFYDAANVCYSPTTAIVVTINSCDSATIVNDAVTTPYNTPVTIDVKANDTVVCTGTKTYELVGSNVTAEGTFTINNTTGIVSVTPNSTFSGVMATRQYRTLCDGVQVGTNGNIVVTVLPIVITANANNDTNTTLVNTPVTGTVATNDVACSSGATTFSVASTTTSGTLVMQSTGSYTYTPNTGFGGSDTATYNLLCNGVIIDTATLTINVTCVPVSGGSVNGTSNVLMNQNYTYSISGLSGTTPYNYVWNITGGTIVSGQGTSTVVVNFTTVNPTLTAQVSNCQNSSLSLAKAIVVKTSCVFNYGIKYNCYTPALVTGALTGISESNRVVSWSNTNLEFTAQVGTHDYTFIITDTLGKIHTLNIKNVTC